jgi:hypothetical protein
MTTGYGAIEHAYVRASQIAIDSNQLSVLKRFLNEIRASSWRAVFSTAQQSWLYEHALLKGNDDAVSLVKETGDALFPGQDWANLQLWPESKRGPPPHKATIQEFIQACCFSSINPMSTNSALYFLIFMLLKTLIKFSFERIKIVSHLWICTQRYSSSH